MTDQLDNTPDIQSSLPAQDARSRRTEQMQNALYEIADAASAVTDMQTFYARLHEIVARLMYGKNFFIAILDAGSGMLSWPYHVDERDGGAWEPIPYKENKGVTSYVLRTGNSLHGSVDAPRLIERGELEIIGTLPEDAIIVPLKSEGRTLGALAIQSYTQGTGYTTEDVQLLTFVAQHIATALTRARAIEETRQRNNELAILNSVGEAMAKTLDVKTVARIVGDKVRDIFGAEVASIDLLDRQTNLFHVMYTYDKGEGGYIDFLEPYPLGKGLNTKIVNSRQPLLLGTVKEQMDLGGYIAPESLESQSGVIAESWMGVPIVAGDTVLGTVTVADYRRYAFRDSDLRLLQTLSSSMGIAIQNARLFEAEQQRNNELAILNSVGEAMAKTLDVKTVARIVGDKVRDIFHADAVGIDLLDAGGTMFGNYYTYDAGEGGYLEDLSPFPLGQGLASKLVVTRQPLLLGTVQEQDANGALRPVSGTDSGILTESWMGVPIIVADKVLGVVSVSDYAKSVYRESDVRLLQTLSSSMGVAIQNARLFEAEQQRISELQIINSIQQGLASKLDLQSIIDLVGDKLRDVLSTDEIGIRLYDEKADVMHYLYELEHGERLTIPPMKPSGLFREQQQHRQPIFGKTVEISARYGLVNLPGTEISKALANVPIIAGDRVIGGISVEDYRRDDAFNESNIRLMQTIASSMGVALENARLFDETQRLFKAEQQRAAELAIINSVQAGLARKLDLMAIVELVGEKMGEIFAADTVMAGMYDESRQWGSEVYYMDRGARVPFEPSPIVRPSLTAVMIDNRQPLLVGTAAEMSELGAVQIPTDGGPDQNESWLGMPILVNEKIIALISVQSYKQHAFDQDDLRLLQTLGNSMSVALENARLFDETQRLLKETEQRNAELAVITSVQGALAAKLEIQGIYDAVGDKLREIFPASDVGIRVYDPQTKFLSFPYVFEGGKRIDISPIPRGNAGISNHVLNTRQPLLINENAEEESARYGSYTIPGTQSEKSALYVPLVVGGDARGVITLSNYEREHAFADSDVRLLSTVANAMSVALESARLFDETQRLLKETEQRNAELAIINSVQEGLASKLDMHAIYELVGEKIRETFGADTVGIMTYDAGLGTLTDQYAFEKGDRTLIDGPIALFGFRKHVIETRKPLMINRNAEGAGIEYGNPVLYGATAKSFIFVPMLAGEQVRGVITLQNLDTEDAYEESDIRLLETLASSMSVALENARLFDETQRLLKETEQRAAELAIINSVQAGLASKLEMQGIYDLVGDKIRGIFEAESMFISVFDDPATTDYCVYDIEGGERNYPEPSELSTFQRRLVLAAKTIVINDNAEEQSRDYGMEVIPGDAKTQVWRLGSVADAR